VERVLDAMLSGWRSQMLARGLIVNTINARYRVINQFVEFTNEHPLRWRPADVDEFLADRRSGAKPITLTTLRPTGTPSQCSARISATTDTAG
jgi:integrase/recombinase XerD